MPGQARHARTSRSQQALANVPVTVSPESHLMSKPSEHHRVSLVLTATLPSCLRLDCGRRGAFSNSSLASAVTRYMRFGLTTAPPSSTR